MPKLPESAYYCGFEWHYHFERLKDETMFTFIKNNELFVLNAMTGEIFRVGLSGDGKHIVIVTEEKLQYQADIDRCIKENNATLVRG